MVPATVGRSSSAGCIWTPHATSALSFVHLSYVAKEDQALHIVIQIGLPPGLAASLMPEPLLIVVDDGRTYSPHHTYVIQCEFLGTQISTRKSEAPDQGSVSRLTL